MLPSSMDKKSLFAAFEAHLSATLDAARAAAAAAHDAATNPESKAENEYDTRGLEAGYLAEAQSRRAGELATLLGMFRTLLRTPALPAFDASTPIGPTALVTVECERNAARYVLLPAGGGLSATVDGVVVQVVTPQSPLGQALAGRRVGDDVEVRVQGRLRDYAILAVE
jgi:hypothetical protein